MVPSSFVESVGHYIAALGLPLLCDLLLDRIHHRFAHFAKCAFPGQSTLLFIETLLLGEAAGFFFTSHEVPAAIEGLHILQMI